MKPIAVGWVLEVNLEVKAPFRTLLAFDLPLNDVAF